MGPTLDCLTTELQLGKGSLKELILKNSAILNCPLNEIKPSIDYLGKRLDLNEKQLGKLIRKAPSLLAFDVESNLGSKLDFLEHRLNLSKQQLSKIIQRNPEILQLSSDNNIGPTIEFLQQRLNLTDARLGAYIRKYPGILRLSMSQNLEPSLSWFQNRLDLTDAQLNTMAYRAGGSLLSLSISDKVEPNLAWLQEQLKLTDIKLQKIVVEQPVLTWLSVPSNLEPTLNFYVDAFDGDDKAPVIRLLTNQPVLFTYSLKRRLEPRLKEAKAANMTIDTTCLRNIAKYTNETWSNTLAGCTSPSSQRNLA